MPIAALTKHLASQSADRGGVGVRLRQTHAVAEQIVESMQALRIALAHGEYGRHLRQRYRLREQALLVGRTQIVVVRGQEEVASLGDFDAGQLRLRAAVLQVYRHAEGLLVFERGRLDRRLETGGAEDEKRFMQGRRVPAGRVPNQERDEGDQDRNGHEER